MKYYILIIGCQMNYSDAERISQILNKQGGQQVAKEKDADLIFVVSCSVRQKAMDKIYGRIKKWQFKRKNNNVKIILTGCVLPSDRIKLKKKFDLFIEIKNIPNLLSLLKLSPKNEKDPLTNADYLAFKPNYSSKFQAYIPIMTGCNNYCTFCAVPYTRGQEASRPSLEIIKEIKELLKNGYKEITLLGQNVNAYLDPESKHSKGVIQSRSKQYWEFKSDQPIQKRMASTKVSKDFAKLLKKINSLPGDFWIRFLSSNPQDISDELIKTLSTCHKIAPYFHFALQSGDDEILRKMNRRHTVKDYIELVSKIRKARPGIAISTDIIVGFSEETKKQFKNSAKIMKKIKFDMAYLAEYSTRPGTTAAKFFEDNVSNLEKRKRKNKLNDILKINAEKINKKLIGKTVPVLVEKYNNKKKENIGKTDTFKTIHFKGKNRVGTFTNVKVTKTNAWGLHGKLK